MPKYAILFKSTKWKIKNVPNPNQNIEDDNIFNVIDKLITLQMNIEKYKIFIFKVLVLIIIIKIVILQQ